MTNPINKAHEQLYNGTIKHFRNMPLQEEPHTLGMEDEAYLYYADFHGDPIFCMIAAMRNGNW